MMRISSTLRRTFLGVTAGALGALFIIKFLLLGSKGANGARVLFDVAKGAAAALPPSLFAAWTGAVASVVVYAVFVDAVVFIVLLVLLALSGTWRADFAGSKGDPTGQVGAASPGLAEKAVLPTYCLGLLSSGLSLYGLATAFMYISDKLAQLDQFTGVSTMKVLTVAHNVGLIDTDYQEKYNLAGAAVGVTALALFGFIGGIVVEYMSRAAGPGTALEPLLPGQGDPESGTFAPRTTAPGSWAPQSGTSAPGSGAPQSGTTAPGSRAPQSGTSAPGSGWGSRAPE